MAAQRAVLECFDDGLTAQTGPSAEWQAGHAAGFAEGLAQARATGVAAVERIAQVMSDQRFTLAEARALLQDDLSGLCTALVHAFLPPFAQAAQGAHIAALLQDWFAEGLPGDGPVLMVAPADYDALGDLSGALPDAAPLRLRADPHLMPGRAILSAGHREAMIDMTGLIRAATEVIAGLAGPTDERKRYA